MWSNSAQIEKRRKMQNLTQLDSSWTNASEAAVTFLQSIAFDVVMTKSIKIKDSVVQKQFYNCTMRIMTASGLI